MQSKITFQTWPCCIFNFLLLPLKKRLPASFGGRGARPISKSPNQSFSSSNLLQSLLNIFFLPFNHTQAKENIQSSSKRNACYGRAPSKEESRSIYTVWKQTNYYWDQIISDIIISDLLFWRDEQTQLERHSFLNVPTQQNYQLWFWFYFFFFNMYRKLFQDFTNKFFDSNLWILNRTTLLETFIFKFFLEIFFHIKKITKILRSRSFLGASPISNLPFSASHFSKSD